MPGLSEVFEHRPRTRSHTHTEYKKDWYNNSAAGTSFVDRRTRARFVGGCT